MSWNCMEPCCMRLSNACGRWMPASAWSPFRDFPRSMEWGVRTSHYIHCALYLSMPSWGSHRSYGILGWHHTATVLPVWEVTEYNQKTGCCGWWTAGCRLASYKTCLTSSENAKVNLLNFLDFYMILRNCLLLCYKHIALIIWCNLLNELHHLV